MNHHRELKRQHETAAIDNFVGWLNRASGSNWAVVEHPNPPDAIITDGGTTSWIEHADLYRHWEEARSEISFILKNHIPHSENPIYDPDRRTALALITLLQRKLSSCSYQPAYEKYGQGFLVISERDPLFHVDTIAEIDQMTKETKIVGDKGYFGNIYLAIRAQGDMSYREVMYFRAHPRDTRRQRSNQETSPMIRTATVAATAIILAACASSTPTAPADRMTPAQRAQAEAALYAQVDRLACLGPATVIEGEGAQTTLREDPQLMAECLAQRQQLRALDRIAAAQERTAAAQERAASAAELQAILPPSPMPQAYPYQATAGGTLVQGFLGGLQAGATGLPITDR